MDQEKIGKYIAQLRKNKNITQEELGNKLNVSSKSISRWENGKCMPDISLFIPLSKELDISVNELLSGEKLKNNNYQKALEENMINIVSKTETNNKKNKFIKLVMILIILTIIPIYILTLNTGMTFTSIKTNIYAKKFYKELKAGNISKVDELLTYHEDQFKTELTNYSREQFLNNLTILKNSKIIYTSFKTIKHNRNAIDKELCFSERLDETCIRMAFIISKPDNKIGFWAISDYRIYNNDLSKKIIAIFNPRLFLENDGYRFPNEIDVSKFDLPF